MISEETVYAFYRDATSDGNVIAVDLNVTHSRSELYNVNEWEGFAGVFDRPNSPVQWTGGKPQSLGDRLTVEEAREIHPRLFDRIGAIGVVGYAGNLNDLLDTFERIKREA